MPAAGRRLRPGVGSVGPVPRFPVLTAVALALVLSGCPDDDGDGTTPTTAQCNPVVFTPNSEDGAGDIRATGLPCSEAEAFVAVAGRLTSSGGPDQLDVEGFHCERVASQVDPLPTSTYECVDGDRKVTFVRS